MKVYVGSQNQAKTNAVKNVFCIDEIETVSVSSKVSSQPYSDEETLEGAINRARQSAAVSKTGIGIGLEGGVMEIGSEVYLCNWGALIDRHDNIFTASGARIPLPAEIVKQLEKGEELGDIMDRFARRKEVREKEGAIGIFTNELVRREEMFTHVIKLLKGQYDYFLNHN